MQATEPLTTKTKGKRPSPVARPARAKPRSKAHDPALPAPAVVPWRLSCPDWAERLATRRTLIPPLPGLDVARADRAVAIFSRLRLPDVPGTPRLGDVVGPWFLEIVRALFGSWDAKANERHIRELFCMVPKKSGKTTLGAALMLTAVLMNDRPRAEFLLIAPTIEVADLAFKQAVGMIEADPVLQLKFHVKEHQKSVIYRPTKAFLKIKSFSPKVVTGSKPAGVLLDEVHVIAESPDADRVLGQLRGGLISQAEGFLVQITTQSERPPSGVFKAELAKARAVRDGRLNAPILPILYEFPPNVDWRDPSLWWMVTPNDGRSVSTARLLPDYEGAVEAGEAELRRWASQHLNVEVGLNLIDDAWSGALYWEAATYSRPVTLQTILDECDTLTIGIDAGGAHDWLAMCVLGRHRQSRIWLAWVHAWVHVKALEHRPSEAQRWKDFERDGDLTVVEDFGADVIELVDIVQRVHSTGLLTRIGMDPAGGAKVLHESLIIDAGIPENLFIGIGQGWRLVGIMKLVERKLAARTLQHGGTAMLAYCVGNARVEMRSNAVLISKAVSKGKIDPVMALLDAAECLAVAPAPIDVDAMIAPA